MGMVRLMEVLLSSKRYVSAANLSKYVKYLCLLFLLEPYVLGYLRQLTLFDSQPKTAIKQMEIPLKFDSQFFKTLQHEVSVLEALQAGEQDAIVEQIAQLSQELTALSKPSRFSKTDMNRWRELFSIYLEANIFFSTHELDHGRRDGLTADTQV